MSLLHHQHKNTLLHTLDPALFQVGKMKQKLTEEAKS